MNYPMAIVISAAMICSTIGLTKSATSQTGSAKPTVVQISATDTQAWALTSSGVVLYCRNLGGTAKFMVECSNRNGPYSGPY